MRGVGLSAGLYDEQTTAVLYAYMAQGRTEVGVQISWQSMQDTSATDGFIIKMLGSSANQKSITAAPQAKISETAALAAGFGGRLRARSERDCGRIQGANARACGWIRWAFEGAQWARLRPDSGRKRPRLRLDSVGV